ncbi:MAG: energy-coupling factor ABC transporter permease, partial [Candidatus Promineifilaceae bacterium]|nr:energy-coupling factor ABC transporter permease [Candidatus Promineifilaceae bacterium]
MFEGMPFLPKPAALHIPDGFLTPEVAALGWLLAIVTVWYALRKTRSQLGERQVPVLGVLAAFIFAAQTINFPVAGGTSGHLLGGALAAVVLGPWAAVLVMTAVVGLQGFLFQDGGLLVMGWNILNMAVLTSLSAWLLYSVSVRLYSTGHRATMVATALASWVSVQVGAAATALELAASGTAALSVTLPAMLAIHAVIGLGEGAITVSAVTLMRGARPDLLVAVKEDTIGGRSASIVAVGMLAALLLAALSLVASPDPDGLE